MHICDDVNDLDDEDVDMDSAFDEDCTEEVRVVEEDPFSAEK